jgi:Fe-S oxidoreductase
MTTEELLHELKKRFDEMLFIGYEIKNKKGGDTYHISCKATMHGGFGLVEVLTRAIEAQEDEE